MARISLSSIIDSSLINKFRGLAGSNASGAALTQSLKGGSSTSSISSGLRFGAQTFSNSLKLLNSAISFINLSEDNLGKLSDITDKLIDLTDRATSASTSEDTRDQLALQFSELANKFRDTVSNSELGGTDYLSKEGLVDLFKKVGLDETQSDTIAAVFSQFTTPLKDDTFASEYIQGSRPINLSSSVYVDQPADTTYLLKRISHGADMTTANAAKISSVNNVYVAPDSILNQNSGFETPFVSDNYGAIRSLTAGSVAENIELLAVNESNGYSVIQSSDNFVGNYNPSRYYQLFLMDPNGNIVAQLTNNTSSNISYDSADISKDNLTVAYAATDIASQTIEYITSPSIGTDPTTLTPTTVATGALAAFDKVKISNDATYIGYSNATSGVELVDVATLTADPYLKGLTNIVDFGFITSNRIAFITNTNDVKEYGDGGGAGGVTTLETGVVVNSKFGTLERDGATGNLYAYYSYLGSGSTVYVKKRTASGVSETQSSVYIGPNANIDNLSLALNPSTLTADLGIEAQLPDFGVNTHELYRLIYNPLATTNRRYSTATNEPDLLLDSTITTRPDAYRTLEDLKALKQQITDNLKALNGAKETINKNIELVRAAGLSFLELSSQITNAEDADTVASKLQKLIRSHAGSALAQAENLQSIVVATLTYG